jgi:hypothetical protein
VTIIHHRPQGRREVIMSEQSPEKAALSEEPEVEGHKAKRAALRPDELEDRVGVRPEDADDQDGPEVEGHLKALKPEDPSMKG